MVRLAHSSPSGSHPLGLPEQVELLLQSLANSTVKQPTLEISRQHYISQMLRSADVVNSVNTV